jgi:FkbM family methyltransferase
MSVSAKTEGPTRDVSAHGGVYREARQALRSLCPQTLLNWREARFYGRYGEVELHLLEFLCDRDRDAIDVGANDGSYVHFMRRYARRVIAFEPMPSLAGALAQKFKHGVQIEALALSDRGGTVALHSPVFDGVTVTGCSTVSPTASATYGGHRAIEVPMTTLDSFYEGDAGFIKIDVEGHQQAVLDGAVQTIRRCRPRMLVEFEERLSPGGFERGKAYFSALDYIGYFVHAGHLEPIARFLPQKMQDPSNLPDLTAPLTQRQRFGRYIYNFIFLPREEPEATLRRMSARLAQL